MEQLVIKKKMEPTDAGITVVYDEAGTGYELEIADYPVDTPIVLAARGWVFDESASNFDDRKKTIVKRSEEYYYLTKGKIPYRLYLRMLSLYPESCIAMWKKNPYMILDLEEGASFSAIDKNTILRSFEYRLYEMKHAINAVLKQNESSGHTFMTYDEFAGKLMNLLQRNGHPLENREHISAYLHYYSELFYFKEGIVALNKTYKAERFIYQKVKEMMLRSNYSGFTRHEDEDLSKEQNKAVRESIAGANICVLTGGPGTGKTTTLRTLVEEFTAAYPDKKVVLLAPTGKASRRIREVFGDLQVSVYTIHYFLGLGHQRNRQESERIKDADFIIIDESSMMGVSLFYLLLSQIGENTKCMIVGDVDQLPSVEPGNVLNDLIQMGVPTSWLTENFRSASKIHQNAVRINNGDNHLEFDKDFTFIEVENDQLSDFATTLSCDILLTPYRKEESWTGDSIVGNCSAINRIKHAKLHPGERYFAPGEPIVVNHTNYKANYINGETGVALRRDLEGVYVTMDDGRQTIIRNLEDIDLSYAQTIHKTQGSEYPVVAICIPKDSHRFFGRQMLYTGITRAKNAVILFGCKEEIPWIIANNNRENKKTFLSLFAEKEQKKGICPIVEKEQEEYAR